MGALCPGRTPDLPIEAPPRRQNDSRDAVSSLPKNPPGTNNDINLDKGLAFKDNARGSTKDGLHKDQKSYILNDSSPEKKLEESPPK